MALVILYFIQKLIEWSLRLYMSLFLRFYSKSEKRDCLRFFASLYTRTMALINGADVSMPAFAPSEDILNTHRHVT